MKLLRVYRTKIFHSLFLAFVRSPLVPIIDQDWKNRTSSNSWISEFLKEKNISLTTESTNESGRNVTSSRIFFGTHYSFLDPLVIVASSKLTKYRLIGVPTFLLLFPKLARHLIPVASRSLIGHGLETTVLMSFFHLNEGYTPEQSQVVNHQVVQDSVQSLTTQKNLIIFPDGGVNPGWFDGIGYIVYEFLQSHPTQKIILQPFYITGISNRRLFLHNLSLVLRLPFMWEISIRYSDEIEIDYPRIQDMTTHIDTKKKKCKKIKRWIHQQYVELAE